MTRVKFPFATAVLLLSLPAAAAACSGLELADGWIREAPPGAPVMAAYARLRNTGAAPLTLSTLSSPEFGAVELHRTVVDDGVSHMLHGQVLQLPPDAGVALEPGGWHLMLFRPLRPLKAGDTVAIAFECGAAARSFSFTVRSESK